MARPGTLLEAGRAGAKRAQRASLAVFGLGLIGVVAWLAIGGSGTAAPIARSGRTPATAPQPCQNAPASFATSSRQQCPPYADIVQAATEREKDRPQLNQVGGCAALPGPAPALRAAAARSNASGGHLQASTWACPSLHPILPPPHPAAAGAAAVDLKHDPGSGGCAAPPR